MNPDQSIEELEADIKRLEEELAHRKSKKLKMYFPVSKFRYFHSSKEDNWAEAAELKLSESAQSTYAYTGLEVTITCLVNEDGTVKATHLNGNALIEPVDI